MANFPTTVEAITAAWLTNTLRAQGCLKDATVTAVSTSPLGVGVGFMSTLQRLTLTYDGPAPDAPKTLVAKLNTTDPGAHQIDGAFNFYEKETGFYREIGALSPIRTPRAYCVEFVPETREFILLLEDLAPARIGDQLEGLSFEEAAQAIAAIAVFHAHWWKHPSLPERDWILHINSPRMKALEPIYQQCWGPVVAFLGDRMPAEVREIGERLSTRVAAMMDGLAARPTTLMHGDYRADNFFFREGADSFAVADWQILMQGGGVFDIAYLMAGSLDIEVRRARERELLGVYHQTLVENGVKDYSLEDCTNDYRHCIMLCWCWPVVAIGSLDTANERGVALFHTWAQRSMTAITDWDAGAMLPV